MMAKRRSWLYLGGTLSSAISVMMVMRLGTWFFGGRALMFQVGLSYRADCLEKDATQLCAQMLELHACTQLLTSQILLDLKALPAVLVLAAGGRASHDRCSLPSLGAANKLSSANKQCHCAFDIIRMLFEFGRRSGLLGSAVADKLLTVAYGEHCMCIWAALLLQVQVVAWRMMVR